MSNKVRTLIIPFFKVDIEILNDSKIKMLRKMPDGDTLFVLWIGILSLAMKADDPGTVELGKGIPFTPDMLSAELDIKIATVNMGLKAFEDLRMIDVFHGETIYVTNFEKHQALDKIRSNREATRKRVANHRERKELLLKKDSNSYNEDCNAIVTNHVTNNGFDCNGTEKNLIEFNRIEFNREKEEEKIPSPFSGFVSKTKKEKPDAAMFESNNYDTDVNRQRFIEIKTYWKTKENLPQSKLLDVNINISHESLDMLKVFPNTDIFKSIDNFDKCFKKIEAKYRIKSFSNFMTIKNIELWISDDTVEEYFEKVKSDNQIQLEKYEEYIRICTGDLSEEQLAPTYEKIRKVKKLIEEEGL